MGNRESGAELSSSSPPLDYPGALEALAALQARDTPDINPLSHTWFRTHGHRVHRAIVFLHGYTNSPPQFQQLGQRLFDRGYNVLVPRLPHHGLADRMTRDHARLTAAELVAATGESVDIAHGLGEEVTVAGLSMGGVMAGWAAQNRADVARAVLIAPGFGFKPLPEVLARPVAFLAARLPPFFIWSDLRRGPRGSYPEYAYPRYGSRALAQLLQLSFAVQAQARQDRPVARSIAVVTNPNDDSSDNAAIARVVGYWRRSGAEHLVTYEFAAELGLPHDLIDPGHPHQRIGLVYPVLVDLIEGQGLEEATRESG